MKSFKWHGIPVNVPNKKAEWTALAVYLAVILVITVYALTRATQPEGIVMKYSKESTDRLIEVQGISIHFNDIGDSKKPALFCFHGGGPGANGWDNTRFNIDGLVNHFRLVLIDLPGYGESDKNAKRPLETPGDTALAQLFAGLMDQLGIAWAHFYASSASAIPWGSRGKSV